MKVYVGEVGPPPAVFVQDGEEKRALMFGNGDPLVAPVWGDSGLAAGLLARVILEDALGDAPRAAALAQRFKWRTVREWKAGQPWQLSHAQVMAVVDDIERVAREAEPLRRQMERERPEMQIDAAPPGAAWSKSPELTSNMKKG